MMRARRAWVFVGVLALSAPGLPSAALADSPPPAPQKAEEADEHFRVGVALYKEQSFAAALVEFRKAYAVLPDWHVLYNIGITQPRSGTTPAPSVRSIGTCTRRRASAKSARPRSSGRSKSCASAWGHCS